MLNHIEFEKLVEYSKRYTWIDRRLKIYIKLLYGGNPEACVFIIDELRQFLKEHGEETRC